MPELRRARGRLARSDGNDGALVAELAKLNQEYAQTQNRLEEVARALEALGSGGPTEDEVREALQKLDPLWDELLPAERERIVKLLVQEVVVSPDGLLIRLRLNGLNSLAAELGGDGPVALGKDGQTVDVRVPMQFKVRGGRKEIILPPDADTAPDVDPQRPTVVALARAYKWQQMLDTGEARSLEELAGVCGVDRSYVGRILNLVSLSPEIVEAILRGQEPASMSLATLRQGVPLLWAEQGEHCVNRRQPNGR